MNTHPLPDYILTAPILTVDDTELNQQMMLKILSRHGFTNITQASDGLDALEKMAVSKPLLIILDLLMPRMDGYTFCKYIKTLHGYENVSIIVQSAVERDDDYSNIFALGVSDFIHKPITPDLLISKIVEHLETRHAIVGQ